MPASRVASLLLKWYSENARDLPWRKGTNPYRIWVSEVMLQQTQVETVMPYYRRWVRRFPTLKSLARAREPRVLRLWEGLGYYSRGRNLHRAARIIVRDMGGRIPSHPKDLRRLPGVGEYIAAAVCSIAFGRDVVALDANVQRVLARLACVRHPAGSPQGRAELQAFGAAHLPAGRAGDFNQALMDLGALVCRPRQPRCEDCPIGGLCEARRRGLQNQVPVHAKSRPRPHYYARAAVIARGKQILIVRRAETGLLAGLWEFPKSPRHSSLPSKAAMLRALEAAPIRAGNLRVVARRPMLVVDHAYSHFSLTVHAYRCTGAAVAAHRDVRWVSVDRLSQYPMGKVDRTIAAGLSRTLLAARSDRSPKSRSTLDR